jgi:hypothetical protein
MHQESFEISMCRFWCTILEICIVHTSPQGIAVRSRQLHCHPKAAIDCAVGRILCRAKMSKTIIPAKTLAVVWLPVSWRRFA